MGKTPIRKNENLFVHRAHKESGSFAAHTARRVDKKYSIRKNRGKTPMIKNIIVVDEHGKKYGTTYPKRAKGLVKQGRARFIAKNTLCLACPPDQNLEDKDMLEQTMDNMETTNTEIYAAQENTGENEVKESRVSIEYCLEQIEQIAHQTDYLNQVLAELRELENNELCSHKAAALSDVIKSRETTNQQMLRFYEKMYDDLKTPAKVDAVVQKAQLQEQLLKVMDKAIENGDYPADKITDMFNCAFDAIRHVTD